MTGEAEAADARRKDPIRLATPRIDDVEARRARASVESRLFPGSTEPLRVGRYRILGRIGQGGMGVVYRAHDPELARDVAVKLMNAESLDDSETATARTRLVREARAMARLAHPNVIHVYDVGAVEDGVFIAMELVEGESLAAWVARAPRDWRDVLRHYVDAGRGLAAAHAAGVIHRDFKPENVLVGADGRVRVGDFGLAGAPALAEAPALDEVRSSDAALDREIVSGTLTRTGALLGTPKYMAPEQEHGVVASDAGDQFSFCVALYEALFGEPPFEGETFAKYRKRVRDGDVRAALVDTKVPKWVRDEIVRGLAVEPTARHRNMDALLDALARALMDPRALQRSWTRVLLVGVPVVIAAVAVGLWVGNQRDAEGVAVTDVATAVPEPEREIVPVRENLPISYPETKATEAKATEAKAVLPPKPVVVPEIRKPPRDLPGAEPRARKGDTCYIREDGWKLIAHRKSASLASLRDEDDNCFVCKGEPPSHVDLTEPGCARYRACTKTQDPTKCRPG